jgi:tripartite ATP-independent transporter DctM subunit
MLETMALLFGKIRGGLAFSVIVVGTMLAASTGIVGATVVTMGLLSLPTMIRRGYSPELAAGTIAASGTLGQIIPPSIVLVLLGSIMNISVGEIFISALIPGLILVFLYLVWIFIISVIKPVWVPAMPPEELERFRGKAMIRHILMAFIPPLFLILAVLGSIFAGVASPTEAAAVGALGATILTVLHGRFNHKILKSVMDDTTHLTCMVFLILIGATAFGLVFRGMDGDRYIADLVMGANIGGNEFLALAMALIFIAGFFIDFIEIIFIIVPLTVPLFIQLDLDLVWVGILIAMNLQTSFLTPPFGFSLFYLKGVAPKEIKTGHIYRGIVPYIAIQLVGLLLVFLFPETVTWLPEMVDRYR